MHYCSDELFQESLTKPGIENWYDWSGIKYFLYEYEEHLALLAKAPVKVSWETVQGAALKESIEHILPQTPSDPSWTARFKAADRKMYTHDFANLCLTLHNSSHGNKPFPEKKGSPGAQKPCYANSSFFVERALAGVNDWTVDTLLDRKQALASWR